MLDLGYDKKIISRIVYLDRLEENRPEFKYSSYAISGMIDFIHYRKKYLLENKDSDKKVQRVFNWILKHAMDAKDSNHYTDQIHSSYLQFIFKANNPTFKTYEEKKLINEYKLNFEKENMSVVKKKEGGKYGVILKVSKKSAHNYKFLNFKTRVMVKNIFDINIFFNSAFFKRCYIMNYNTLETMSNDLTFHWKIVKGERSKNMLGLQKWGYQLYCIVFPIYKTGTTCHKNFCLYKHFPLLENVNVFMIRTRKTLSKKFDPVNRDFHQENINTFFFLSNRNGIMGIYVRDNILNYIYMTDVPFEGKGIIHKNYKENLKNEIKAIMFFKKDCLIYNDNFSVTFTRIKYKGTRPELEFITKISPFDALKGVAVTENKVFLLGYATIQVLDYKKENFMTEEIISHNMKFGEEAVYATNIKNDLFILSVDKVYSFRLKK